MENLSNTEQLEQNLLRLHQNYVGNKEADIPDSIKQIVAELENKLQSDDPEILEGGDNV